MATIKDQLDLEKRMIAYGITRYRKHMKAAQEGGRAADADVSPEHRLLHSVLEDVAVAVEEAVKPTGTAGRSAVGLTLLRSCDPYKAAYIALRVILNSFLNEFSVTTIAYTIGTQIEDELKFTKFQSTCGEYYNTIIDDFKRKGTKSYRHMHRVLTVKANEHEIKWNSWSRNERIQVGTTLVSIIEKATSIFTITKAVTNNSKQKTFVISPTQDCLDWINRYNRYAEMLTPDRTPCIIPPDPWSDYNQGGYYSPQLRLRTPLVKTRSDHHKTLLEQTDMTEVMSALNTLQKTAWEVNTEVLDVLTQVWNAGQPIGLPQSRPYIIPDCPIKGKKKSQFTLREKEEFEAWKSEARIVHTMERERMSKCFQVLRVLNLANEFKEYDKFWFVYQCDFRGRIYSTVSGMSPQGADFGKAVLRFYNAKPLGKQGAMWFKIHGANTYGNDKLPYADRIKWVDSEKEQLLRVANDPMRYSDYWGSADEPWQFLAWLLEYKEYCKQGDSFESKLAIGMDGSCNGLQNFSAMLRDRVGGTATNLVPADKPSDIYARVAEVLTDKLRKLNTPEAAQWLRLADKQGGTLSRKLTKRPVMTLPYGSTRQSCQEYILRYIIDEEPDMWDKRERFLLCVYLTRYLWQSINEVVVAAREAMDWLKTCASKLAKAKYGTTWTTPTGFIVYHSRLATAVRRVRTQLNGDAHIRVQEPTTKIDIRKQMQAIAPNFVHSMDASHLMKTINAAAAQGIENFSVVHDDYGTSACDTAKLQKLIRQEFVQMYTENDVLQNFKDQNDAVALPDIPERGDLVLDEVLKSAYFFS